MTIYVNGRELDKHGLVGKSEARRRAGLYPEGLLRLLGRSARDELADSRCAMVEEVQELNRALYESGANLEPPPDLAREGERKGRLESFLRRLQTRFIRAVCEGYVQQQQLFNSYLSKGLILCFLQVYGREEEVPLKGEEQLGHYALSFEPWDRNTLEEVAEACNGSYCLVLGIPSVELLEVLRERASLVLALDTSEETVARAQGLMLPAWCGTRFADLLELADRGAEVCLLTRPELLPARELEKVLGWLAGRLPEGGRVLVARNLPPGVGVVEREGWTRPHTAAVLAAMLKRHHFEVRELRLGSRDFLEGLKPEGGEDGRSAGPRPAAEEEVR
ncbi:hypothetical protein [Candidatus Solincola sp.]|nr:hypothetical protein [Actinomycetota bacterium]MDI7252059.1 hypothetical protein [Actinomycetota bacterium]